MRPKKNRCRDYYLDGLLISSNVVHDENIVTPNPDEIAEVKILQNNFSAQYSLMGASHFSFVYGCVAEIEADGAAPAGPNRALAAASSRSACSLRPHARNCSPAVLPCRLRSVGSAPASSKARSALVSVRDISGVFPMLSRLFTLTPCLLQLSADPSLPSPGGSCYLTPIH